MDYRSTLQQVQPAGIHQDFAKFDSNRCKVQYIDELDHVDLYIVYWKSLIGFLQNPHLFKMLEPRYPCNCPQKICVLPVRSFVLPAFEWHRNLHYPYALPN